MWKNYLFRRLFPSPRNAFSAHNDRTLIMAHVTLHDIARRTASLKASLSNDTIITENNQTMAAKLAVAGHAAPFIPKNPSACQVIQSLFMDEESADVVIQVGGKKEAVPFDAHQFILGQVKSLTGLCGPVDEELTSTISDTKVAPATFYAHKFILRKCSKTLFELCLSGSPIQITNLSPHVFRFVLFYMYGGTIAKDDMETNAKDIIEAADWFKVSNLKLEAEACLLETTTFTVENVMDHLLYADSKNCALMEEAAMDFIIKNKTEVFEKVSMKNVAAGILADILAAVARAEKTGTNATKGGGQFGTMHISELRLKAHEKELDVGGSREMLIAALEKSV
jgi:hypothetical protein